MRAPVLAVLAALSCVPVVRPARAAAVDEVTAYVKPLYLPPGQLVQVLNARDLEGRTLVAWPAPDGLHAVELRRNDAANLLILSGAAADVEAVQGLIRAADVPPRQIAIEARIVEVDEARARDAGIDWSTLRTDVLARYQYDRRTDGGRLVTRFLDGTATATLANALRLLDEKGAATFRDSPRILTLNNQQARILDGQRVTYITRYSSFANIFVTDSMDAGLQLDVLPSLGESGYLTLQIRAELTTLSSNISGSPVKDGQMVENTVVVKDGESVVLGGFTRTEEQKIRRRFPVLGSLLPFAFSREITNRTRRESFVVLTPRVVDLAPRMDERTRELLQPGLLPGH